ncbi:MAG: methionine--tRNA ligase [Candidatus Micrarchaeota archaeon]
MTITIDDFKKIELKIGTVESAERVEGTAKLVKLVVDLGAEKRELVAGIADAYALEELKGKQIVVLANLEERIIKGCKSQGMLLAADGDKPVLLTVDKQVQNGVGIR